MNNILASAAYLVFRALGLLPLFVLQGIGTGLGHLGAVLPGKYRTRAYGNLRRAYPEATPAMDRAAMIELLQMFLELPYLWATRNARKLDKIIRCDQWPVIDDAVAQGKGVILISPHIGAFEMLGPFYTRRHKATVIFKEPRMRWLRLFINRIRLSPSLKLVPANQTGVKALVKTLLKGETIGFLPDQVPALGDGVYAPFFGKDAYTITLVQRMQAIRNSPIFTVGLERLPNGRGYHFHVVPMTEALSESPELAAAQINAALEQMIRKMPMQYLWGYNRYKTPRPDRAS
ncbi:MAG: lysophospholipid acyltransferase family protein [Fluviibacter sp.]